MSDSCNPMDCNPPGSSVRGIFRARILEWVAISFSKDLPDPGIEPGSPALHIKRQRHYFAYKGLSSQSYGFSSSHVWVWELDHNEGWAPNWCFWIVVLEYTLESLLDCKKIKPVNPKGNQSWIFIGCWSWNSNTLATWCEELTYWKRPGLWRRLKAEG